MKTWLQLVSIFLLAMSAEAAPPPLIEFTGNDLRIRNIGNSEAASAVASISLAKSPSTVVLFLSAKCPCSMSHMEEVRTLAKDFPNVQFVAINSNKDETLEMGRNYFSQADLTFPVVRDENLKYADQLKAVKTPHAFILNRSGNILYQGGVSDSAKFPNATRKFLREALTDLSKDQEIRTPLARALGCSIFRGE